MAIPAGVTRVTISGHIVGGEHWATSFWVNTPAAPLAGDAGAEAIAGSATATLFRSKLLQLMAVGDGVDDLDVYTYTGGTAASDHGHASFPGNGGGTDPNPKQTSFVITLRTGSPGRSKRGRMYLPYTGGSVDAAGHMDSALVDSTVDALANWFDVLRDAGSPAVVVSQTTTSRALVTGLDADYLPDTQRRRRNKLTSARHSTPLA